MINRRRSFLNVSNQFLSFCFLRNFSPWCYSESLDGYLECNAEPVSIAKDRVFLDEAEIVLEEFEIAMLGVTESVTEFCGTVDRDLFADIISTTSAIVCVMIALILDVRDALKCKTWMPLYYNTCEYFPDE